MTLDDVKYIEILEFVLNCKPYREIAKSQGVSKNTVTDLIKRLRNTGSIFPSKLKKIQNVKMDIDKQIVKSLFLEKSLVLIYSVIGCYAALRYIGGNSYW